MRTFTVLFLMTLLASSSVSIAKSRKAVERYRNPIVAMPEDPQAYAMRIARQTWGSYYPLCDDGGYRIRPCYLGNGDRGAK
jgi:hypothetical protein